ncbi:hypothetical protein ACHAPJ_008270 [Fusarium lateritium]
MASLNQRVLTYHVVPRFDIPAKGGPLSLGTILSDLKRLVPLNRKFVIDPGDLAYTPVSQTDFKNSLARARQLNFEAWVKALGLPVGASTDAGGSSDIEDSVSCDSIITTYFDPDDAYIKESFQRKPIQDKLDAAKEQMLDSLRMRTTDLYLVTGLKVAKNLKFNKSGATERHINTSVEGSEPHTNAAEGGFKGEASETKEHSLEFTVDDIIIGYRVNHYSVKRVFGKNKEPKDKGVLDGDMQDDGESEGEQPQLEFEPIPEGPASRDSIKDPANNELWIN